MAMAMAMPIIIMSAAIDYYRYLAEAAAQCPYTIDYSTILLSIVDSIVL